MAKSLGSGVSRVLDPRDRSFTQVILQKGKPPMDAEWNLLQEISVDAVRSITSRSCPSGWLASPFNPSLDFVTNPSYSNWFQFGQQPSGETRAFPWAVVNGWLIPVTGTRTGTPPGSPDDVSSYNKITLDPPPANAGDSRFDFVFLEVWQARIPPNPSSLNKPGAGYIHKYGNVEGGASFIVDDLKDPSLGQETSQRVQLQYRIRVVTGLVGLSTNPSGFDPAVVKAQGGAAAPTTIPFTNQRLELGDPGLWRAGNGDSGNSLNTVDGYVYAIPLCGVFRRNSVAWNGDPSPNLNGGVNRNPTAVDRTGVKTFSTVPALAAGLSAAATSVQLNSSANSPLPGSPAVPLLVRVGDELMTYSSISGGPPVMSGLTRGVNGTRAEAHLAGSEVVLLSQNPYGLFSDQIVAEDIYDLRHVVDPGDFDYNSLLARNLDALLRGRLRSVWKRTGTGIQGTVLPYQDKIVSGSAALGITKLDGPDNIRTIYSDAAVTQSLVVIVKPNGSSLPAAINSPWSLTINATHTVRAAPGLFSPGDEIVLPVGQLKSGLPGSDIDQVRWLNEGSANVKIQIDGWSFPLDYNLYTTTPVPTTPGDDLTITLGPDFPATANQLIITAIIFYGPGRGLSRRPHEFSSAAFLSASSDLLLSGPNVPTSNRPIHTSWTALWSGHRRTPYKGQLPTTSESFIDLGSKTAIICPFRRIDWPDDAVVVDGTSANPRSLPFYSGLAGVGVGSTTFQDAGADFTAAGVVVGDLLVLSTSPATGKYQVVQVSPGGDVTKLTVNRPIPTAAALIWNLYHCQGVMPLLKADGVTPKWTTTDPLGLFSGTTDPIAATKNLYVSLPRDLVPGWGAYHVPIVWQDGTFAEGVNYMSRTLKGSPPFGDEDKNYVPYSNGPLSFSSFSTLDLNPPMLTAPYNGTFSFGGITFAGARKFTDSRGLGRKGLELPPFYGIARLFAVYEAVDYKTQGSSYDATTRAYTGTGATNLLRQAAHGPSFWIEIDDDGDSTFVLNADCLDLEKVGITDFDSEDYVIEANIFGFDRGSFDATKDFRLVLTRPTSPSLMRSQAADLVTRVNNVGAVISGPVSVLSGPATAADAIVLNYRRVPYQGDAWGSQSSYVDSGYAQGPLTTAIAYQISSTVLDQDNLTRPNQKAFEVLASIGFSTTLGTGRLSGEAGTLLTPPVGLQNVGYEDLTAYPPGSLLDPRPDVLPNALQGESAPVEIGTDYLGCVDRLPLGSLFRDKDFRGGTFSDFQSPLVYHSDSGISYSPSLAVGSSTTTATSATGSPGDLIVHVDGEQGNYSLLTNYRTTRGGSLFSATGPDPGGELAVMNPALRAPQGRTNVISGRAMLVRSLPTTIAGSEVSAGDELAMVVVTTASQLTDANKHPALVVVGTNGAMEGYSAADYYRIEGHPLVGLASRLIVDVDIPLTAGSKAV